MAGRGIGAMTKREFLKTLGVAAFALGHPIEIGAGAAPRTSRPRPVRTKNWVWMTPKLDVSAAELKRSFAVMRASGIDAVTAEIYNGQHAFYRSRRFPVKAEWLETVLPLATAEHLEVHAWMWTMPCLLPDVISKHPDWYNVNAKGESAVDKPAYVDYYKFLDPARPEVREFIRGTVHELAEVSGLAGIHLDYVRHPDAILPKGLWAKYGIVQDRVYPPYDYGYTPYSRGVFKAKHGVDPLTLPDPESNPDWMQYRLDSVVDLVNDYLVPAAHAGGKMITAAVFPGPSLAKIMVRQDWGRFKLDAFLPMLYHRFYEAGPDWVKTFTEEAVATVTAPVYSGLYVAPLDEAEFSKTVALALQGGAGGVSIFDAGAMNPDRWKTLASAVARG
jgi:uncharacterized lipoprotein YddW (UPF0748 family)